MGQRIALAHIGVQPISPPYGFDYTSAALDEAREKWLDSCNMRGGGLENPSGISGIVFAV